MFLLVGEALTTVEEEIKLDVFLVNIALRLPLNGKEEFNNKLSFLAQPGGGGPSGSGLRIRVHVSLHLIQNILVNFRMKSNRYDELK